jgi:hypothetical protein
MIEHLFHSLVKGLDILVGLFEMVSLDDPRQMSFMER